MKTKTTLTIISILLLTVLIVNYSDASLKRKVKQKIRIVSQSIGDAQLKDGAIGSLRVILNDLITSEKIKNETLKNEDIASDANISASKLNLNGKNVSQIHDQNTDTGTNQNNFTLGQTGNDINLFFGSSNRALTYDKNDENFKINKPLSLENNKISNLAEPIEEDDAVNKEYVDNAITEVSNPADTNYLIMSNMLWKTI